MKEILIFILFVLFLDQSSKADNLKSEVNRLSSAMYDNEEVIDQLLDHLPIDEQHSYRLKKLKH